MKKLVSIFLALSLLFSCAISLAACRTEAPGDNGGNPPLITPTPPKDPAIGDGDGLIPLDKVVVPEYKDYGRGSANFADIVYNRPDFDSLIATLDAITAAITENRTPYADQLASLEEIEDEYGDAIMMRTLAEIYFYANTNNEYYAAEYEFVSLAYPRLIRAVENMMCAAALSENAESFERDYFGEGLIEDYSDGGKYTDEVFELILRESELENTYSSISTANTEITYGGRTATVDEFLAETTDPSFILLYQTLYRYAAQAKAREIFLELVGVRLQIADTLGLENYSELGYEDRGYTYSYEDTVGLIENISKYLGSIYPELSVYFHAHRMDKVDTELSRVELLNTLYSAFLSDDGLKSAYSYMLQHGLYNVDKGKNRFSGAFTTYLYENKSPFVFVTLDGFSSDYLTLAHEFGHFYDAYKNYGMSDSLDLAEISSQALELLSIKLLHGKISEERYAFLKMAAMIDAVEAIMSQCFVSLAEHLIYSIDYELLSEESINEAVKSASLLVFGDERYASMDKIIMTHTISYPFYVQSYFTSLLPSLEIFFLELNEDGAGLSKYKELVSSYDDADGFVSALSALGLASPFDEETVILITNKIYSFVTGKCDKYSLPQ